MFIEPSVCGIIDGNSSGYHLISCENHTCLSIYFKCPGYYCLPWRFVCNGQWDCPGGMEEIHCNRTACPGMFKCRMSSICIPHVSICDNITDCPLKDDQHFCDRSLNLMSCPTNCSCLVFSIFCQELTLNVLNNFKHYLSIQILNLNLTDDSAFWYMLDVPLVLALKNSTLLSICKQAKVLEYLKMLDISFNGISKLGTHCFQYLYNIHLLNISFNKVSLLQSYTFSRSIYIKSLDLAWNEIRSLDGQIFSGLFRLLSLNLTENSIISVSDLTFYNTSVSNIITINFRICCVKPMIKTQCAATPVWPNTCSKLLGSTIVMIIIWLISIVGFLMNASSLLILLRAPSLYSMFDESSDNMKLVPTIKKTDF